MQTLHHSKIAIALLVTFTASFSFANAAVSPPSSTINTKVRPSDKAIHQQVYDLYTSRMNTTALATDFLNTHDKLLAELEKKTTPPVEQPSVSSYKIQYETYKNIASKVNQLGKELTELEKKAAESQALFALITQPLPLPKPGLPALYDQIKTLAEKDKEDPLVKPLLEKLEKLNTETSASIIETADKAVKLDALIKEYSLPPELTNITFVLAERNKDIVNVNTYNLTATIRELFKNLQNQLLNQNEKVFDYTRSLDSGAWAFLDHSRLAHKLKEPALKLNQANNKSDLTSLSFGYQKVHNGVRFGILANLGRANTNATANLVELKHNLAQAGLYVGASNPHVFIEGGILAGVDKINATTLPEQVTTKAKFSAKTLGLIINGGYRFKIKDNLSITPVVSYQYQQISGIKTNLGELDLKTDKLGVNSVGVSLKASYQLRTDIKLNAKLGVSALKRTGSTNIALPNLAVLPDSQVNVVPQSLDKDLRTSFTLSGSKQFGKANVGAAVGYDYYSKSKLKGLNLGINLGYQF